MYLNQVANLGLRKYIPSFIFTTAACNNKLMNCLRGLAFEDGGQYLVEIILGQQKVWLI